MSREDEPGARGDNEPADGRVPGPRSNDSARAPGGSSGRDDFPDLDGHPDLDHYPRPDDYSDLDTGAGRPSRIERPDRGTRLVPRTVKVLLVVIGIEVVMLLFASAFLVSTLLQNAEPDLRLTVVTLMSAVLASLTLAAAGLAILRGRRWGRTPLATWQVLQVLMAMSTFTSQARWLGLVMMALSVTALVALASPGVRRHLSAAEDPAGF